jgi:hypothetical protein|tara:strand:+ start:305 stop:481 length:177 start_codon:yes stop_codon:yes gene_type:complete
MAKQKAIKVTKMPGIKKYNPGTTVNSPEQSSGTVKTSGIKIRGVGAATKGIIARGPMA